MSDKNKKPENKEKKDDKAYEKPSIVKYAKLKRIIATTNP